MKFLPDIDLEEKLNVNFRDSYLVRNNSQELFDKLALTTCSLQFKNEFLQLVQLFSDGIIEGNFGKEKEIIENVSEDLFQAGKYIIGSFYRGINFDKKAIKDLVFSNKELILKYSIKSKSSPRHLDRGSYEIQKLALDMKKVLEKNNYDLIVPVANGGYEGAFLFADILEIKEIFPIRFSNFNRTYNQDYSPKIWAIYDKKELSNKFYGKRILCVEDLVCSGESLVEVMKFIDKEKPKSLNGIAARISKDHIIKNSDISFEYKDPFFCKLI